MSYLNQVLGDPGAPDQVHGGDRGDTTTAPLAAALGSVTGVMSFFLARYPKSWPQRCSRSPRGSRLYWVEGWSGFRHFVPTPDPRRAKISTWLNVYR